MAIQFNCPYCTASIKVGDAAAGKIGSCPKCGTKLRVPIPQRPQASAPSAGTPAPDSAPAPVIDDSGPALNPPQPADTPDSGGIPEFAIDAPAVQTSYARQVKQRRKGAWASLMIPLLFAGLLAAAAGGYWWFQRETMTGPLTGERLPPGEVLIGRIPPGAGGVPRQEYLDVVAGLRIDPAVVSSKVLRVEFRGGPYGVEVWVSPGPESDIVRVPVRQHPAVAGFYTTNAARLNEPLQAELQAAAKGFMTDYQNAASSGMVIGNAAEYRDALGLNSLLGGLGYHSAALVGTTYYPCVHEDDGGRLYFAVPRGTTTFIVTERPFEERDSVFPGEYRFEVTVADPPAPVQTDEAETELTEPDEQTSADEGDQADSMMEPEEPAADAPEEMPDDPEDESTGT